MVPRLAYLASMNIKLWQVIRDDAKKTFEVCGSDSNVNHFTNSVHGMQRAGMNVTGMTPPVTNKLASRGAITIPGYKYEQGLYKRLTDEYIKMTRDSFEE